MPVILRTPTYRRLLDDREQAIADADIAHQLAEEAQATAATVLRNVDTALCALATVHDMDPDTGVCSCGHPSPCPTAETLSMLFPYWESMPSKLEGVVDRTPRAVA